jgi:Fe-S cluster assembly protein SufD
MTPDDVLATYRDHAAALPGGSRVTAEREAALARFAELGYPTRKLEDWRYTDLAAIAGGEFDLFPTRAAQPAPDIEDALARAGLAHDAAALVFVDGTLVGQRHTQNFGDGIEILSLPESLDRYGATIEAAALSSRALGALNVALAHAGAHLRIAANADLRNCLHLIFVNRAARPVGIQPQLAVELAANARAQLALHFVGDGPAASWTNMLTKITLATGAQLTVQRVQTYDSAQLHTELVDAELAAAAALSWVGADLGGKLVRNDVRVRLAGPGAACNIAGIALCAAQQHVDNHIAVEHLASHTVSEQTFRSIVGAHGRGVFNGKVVVHEGTKGISANQASDNLLLDDTGEIDTKPELEIHTDDVKCSHGATVGELDEVQLFYLKTRGIADAAARGLLTLGFANEILQRLDAPGLAELVVAKFGLALPDDPTWRAPA